MDTYIILRLIYFVVVVVIITLYIAVTNGIMFEGKNKKIGGILIIREEEDGYSFNFKVDYPYDLIESNDKEIILKIKRENNSKVATKAHITNAPIFEKSQND